MIPALHPRALVFSLICLLGLALTPACEKREDAAAPQAPAAKPAGTELSTVAGTSIKRAADETKAGPEPEWTFEGLDAKGARLEELVLRTLPPDGWMGDVKLPEGRYDVKLEASGKTPEEMRPLLFKAIESAFGLKLDLARKDMDGFVIRAEASPTPALAKADAGATFAIDKGDKGRRFTAVSMDTFADWAARELERPVANATDLEGKYTFELPVPDVDPAALTAAVKSLGLQLEPQQLEQQVLVAEQAAERGAK